MKRAHAAVVAMLLGAFVPVTAGPAAAQATGATLRLLDRTPWVGDGSDFSLSVHVGNAPSGSQLQLTVHDRVRSRSEFARTINGEGLRRRLSGPSPVAVSTLDSDNDGAVSLLVPLVAAEGRQPVTLPALPTPEAYPVVVELLDDSGGVLDTLITHLVRLAAFDPDATAAPLGVATVVALHASPVHLDPAGPTDPRLPLAPLAEALAAHPNIALNLSPTPESIDGASVTDPDGVAAFAVVLGASQVIASPWVDLDEAAWANADDSELARQLAVGGQILISALGVQPDATRLAPSEALPAEIAAMVNHGAEVVVVDQADLEALDPSDFPYTLARPFRLGLTGEDGSDAGTVAALASDRALADLADTADDDPVLAAHQILADLAVVARDEQETARVATLVLPDAAAESPTFLTELLEGLEPPVAPAAPVVVSTTIAEAMATVEPAGADGGADADDPLVRRLVSEGPVGNVRPLADLLAEERADLASFRSIFGAGDALAAGIDEVLTTAAASDLSSTARAGAIESAVQARDARLAGIHGPERQQVTLTAREGRIQLLLTNDTGVPASVTLLLRGDRLVFPDAPDGRLDVLLSEPTTRVELRVEARSSGDAPLDIRLTSPDGRLDLGQSRITVRTTAVSGVGVLLMGTAALFLAAWWTRTILRERRAARRRHPAHVARRRGSDVPQP